MSVFLILVRTLQSHSNPEFSPYAINFYHPIFYIFCCSCAVRYPDVLHYQDASLNSCNCAGKCHPKLDNKIIFFLFYDFTIICAHFGRENKEQRLLSAVWLARVCMCLNTFPVCFPRS